MKRSLLVLALLAALFLVAAPAYAAGTPHVIATLPYGDFGSFAESMAPDGCGGLCASLTVWGNLDPIIDNVGQIWRIRPSGGTSLVTSQAITPFGMLTGIARDRVGCLYVADVDFSGETGSVIYRVARNGTWTQIAQLEPGTFPNGLALRNGDLYVSDSAFGAIWRIRLGCGLATRATSWIQSDLLAPADPATGLGINGIAFRGGSLFGVVSDSGRVVRIPLCGNGAAGTPRVVCESSALLTADGIAFDALGRLWVTTNEGPTADEASGALFRVSPAGCVRQVPVDPAFLDYPTQPVFGTTLGTCTTLFVLNGAFSADQAPFVTAIKVGVLGQPLPLP